MTAVHADAAALEAFVTAVYAQHGLDLRGYARASLLRRVRNIAQRDGHLDIASLAIAVRTGNTDLTRLIDGLSVSVTEMFRNPSVFRCLRDEVFPVLASWPQITIWHAGCATGEEVLSLAILLREAGLYARCQIYATDIHDAALAKAREGIFAIRDVAQWSRNYQQAGGSGSFSDYYHAAYGHIRIDPDLQRNIHYAHHNLAVDGVFCEAQMVVCRNVLIYFDRALQHRVLDQFRDSLSRGGFLCLGNRESIDFAPAATAFEGVDRDARIYRLLPS